MTDEPLAAYLRDLDEHFKACRDGSALREAYEAVEGNPLLDTTVKAEASKVFVRHVRRFWPGAA